MIARHIRVVARCVPLVTVIALFAQISAAHAQEPAFGRRPNIILIMTDDQGYGDLSCHGNPVLQTPNLDKLHARSMRFTAFHVSPTCAPTRSALMSGRAPFYVGVTHTILERERLKPRTPIMPEMLRAAGYTTGIFGKWHLGDQDPYRPDKHGFDEVFIHGAGGIGQSYEGSCGDAPENTYQDPYILHNNVFEKTSGFCTDVLFAQATKWMEGQKGKQPFFCYLPTNAPHAPYNAPQKYAQPFLAAGLTQAQAGYYGMIVNIDENVGRLMQQLDDWGIAEDTLLIFLTDNGPAATTYALGMKGRKGSVDEGGTRAPLFMRWPGVLEPGRDIDRVARHFDLLPTIAEIVGATPDEPELLQGRSLLPLLQNPAAAWEDRMLFFHQGRWPRGEVADFKYRGFAVRSQKWRLVGTDALYDIENDPNQKTNVITRHPDVAKEMLTAYEAWWDGAQPNLVNEDAPLNERNTFHLMFWKQYNITPPEKEQ